MPANASLSRCTSCGRRLPFERWSAGHDACAGCDLAGAAPAAVFERSAGTALVAPDVHRALAEEYARYERVLDELPDELVDELVAALEGELEARRRAPGPGLIGDALDEIRAGRAAGELRWAGWGFTAGFAANVLLAKYAQVTSGGTMGEFLAPMLLGGVVAGGACAAIAWGVARLRSA